jgi:hypothetical protein
MRAAEAHDGHIGEGGPVAADSEFEWDGLAKYKAEGRFLDGYREIRERRPGRLKSKLCL